MSKRLRKQANYCEDDSDEDFLKEDDEDDEIEEYKEVEDENDKDYGEKDNDDDDDDYDYDDDDDDEKKKKKKTTTTTTKRGGGGRRGRKTTTGTTTTTTTRGRKKKTDEDAEEEEEEEKPKSKAKPRQTRGRKGKKDADDEDDKAMSVESSESEGYREEDDGDVYEVHKDEDAAEEGAEGNARPEKSIEEQYQKLTQLEHVLRRPDTYIGSVEKIEEEMWTLSDDMRRFEQRKITYVPGLYKIFDEIIVNAADNKQRDPKMSRIDVRIDAVTGEIDVWNNGLGIPVEKHKTENMYVPELIFGHLLTGSNYNDNERKVTGGKNGLGAKLANIFSLEFRIETADGKNCYKQRWANNMGTMDPYTIAPSKQQYTRVTFRPDYARFKMPGGLEEDSRRLMCKRVYDLAGCNGGLKVYLNGNRVPISSFKDYITMYLRKKEDEEYKKETASDGDGDDDENESVKKEDGEEKEGRKRD